MLCVSLTTRAQADRRPCLAIDQLVRLSKPNRAGQAWPVKLQVLRDAFIVVDTRHTYKIHLCRVLAAGPTGKHVISRWRRVPTSAGWLHLPPALPLAGAGAASSVHPGGAVSQTDRLSVSHPTCRLADLHHAMPTLESSDHAPRVTKRHPMPMPMPMAMFMFSLSRSGLQSHVQPLPSPLSCPLSAASSPAFSVP